MFANNLVYLEDTKIEKLTNIIRFPEMIQFKIPSDKYDAHYRDLIGDYLLSLPFDGVNS